MYTKEFRKVVVSMGVVPGSVWVAKPPGMVSSQREMLRTWKSTIWTVPELPRSATTFRHRQLAQGSGEKDKGEAWMRQAGNRF